MSMVTPFVKRMRVQGGTIFTFSSANEDIGLNINERNNVVKMSHFALLNIPSIKIPSTPSTNQFNVFAIPSALKSWEDSLSVKDGRVMVSESFQNYALNLEANLLDSSTYNPNLLTSVSERVFWKWLKETGAIRWEDYSGGYWQEEVSTNYSSVVKCIGQITAGSVRTDNFGTYNETYVLVPTSYGQTEVYFKQVEDDNYKHGMVIPTGNSLLPNILGRNPYTKPHPDALDYKAYYDVDASSKEIGSYTMQYQSAGWQNGWWMEREGISPKLYSYYTDVSSYILSGVYNTELKYTGAETVDFLRSNVDCMSIELDLDNLRTITSNPSLTYDNMAIEYAINDRFEFNAILLYYSVYNKTYDKLLATNLQAVMFLDYPSGNSTEWAADGIQIQPISKIQSGPTGFGTSYSFRVNIKSDSMLDDTQAVIYDKFTTPDILENFADVFTNLEKSVNILNQHTGTINFITEQYLDMNAIQSDVLNQIKDLQYTVNDINRDITGTENTIPIYIAGDDPIGDSSIYMKAGNVGIKNDNPLYTLDVSGNIHGAGKLSIDGSVGIGTFNPSSPLQVMGILEYADNSTAIIAGLTPGAIYRTGEFLKIVY